MKNAEKVYFSGPQTDFAHFSKALRYLVKVAFSQHLNELRDAGFIQANFQKSNSKSYINSRQI